MTLFHHHGFITREENHGHSLVFKFVPKVYEHGITDFKVQFFYFSYIDSM